MEKLEELKLDLIEVRAYRDLQGEPFDFGTGLITNDSKVSEDVYYKREERELLNAISEIKEEKKNENFNLENGKISGINKEKERNRRYLDKKAKIKLERLSDQGVYMVYKKKNHDTGNTFVTRFYLSGLKKEAKKQTNKRIRKSVQFPLNGGGYRKVFDYWWTVF